MILNRTRGRDWCRSRVSPLVKFRTATATAWKGRKHVHLCWGDIEGVEGDVPAILFTEDGFPYVGVEALVVVGSRIWDFVRGERVMLCVVLEGELSGACEH
jgi:hypothetical protein